MEKEITLTKYLAHCGVCSRRKAEELIKQGVIFVNNAIQKKPAYKLSDGDIVRYKKVVIKPQQHIYILLNKPAGYVTTVSDPLQSKTIMQLLTGAPNKRIYPVGRLDKATTGLLLITNDGDLAQKLMHPKNNVKKVYHVVLDRILKDKDLQKIRSGVFLKDGKAGSDRAFFVSGSSKRKVGIQIHSGKNRVIRRILKQLGYNVTKLDRVVYATLTKRGLALGSWRLLRPDEVAKLKAPATSPKGARIQVSSRIKTTSKK